MTALLPFRPHHICSLALRKADAQHLAASGYSTTEQHLELGRLSQAAGPAFTLVTDGHTTVPGPATTIACGGVVLFTPQTGMAWLLTSALVQHYPLALHKTCCAVLKKVAQDFSLNRMQAIVQQEHTTSKRWLEHMGFIQEALMKKYIKSTNYYLYARTD